MKAMDEMIAAEKNPAMQQQLKMTRVQFMLQDVKNPKLAENVAQAYQDHKENPSFINLIAWRIYGLLESGDLKSEELVKASRTASEAAAAASEGASKAAILDTAAHFQLLDGDADAALKSQEEAIKLADDSLRADLEKFLEEIKKKIK